MVVARASLSTLLNLAPACSLQHSPSSSAHADAAVNRTGGSVAYRSTAPKNPLRSGALADRATSASSCMGQRLSSNNMAANAEKIANDTTGEEKTFVCAVSTGS